MKKIILTLITFILFIFNSNIYANNANVLYEESETQTITDGLTYQKVSRLYKSGWKDIYILNVDVKNDNIDFEVIQSTTEYGLKKSVEALAKENNVVAAVNGDFFSSGNPTSSMGQVIRDGNLNETTNYYNGSENKYAGIFLDKYGNAFIDYVKSTIGFYLTATESLELQAKNKVSTNFTKPVYFDTTAIKNTANLDKRVKNLYKIVVENGVITKISTAGETVNVPENGYIIVMNQKTASENINKFYVGQSVSFSESASFVFRPTKSVSEILTGISGGGEILRNGSYITQGLISGANVRNPRTMIGVNQAKDKIIIMLVDGRGASLGATHKEAGELMKEFGAYDAIHLDGGGSSTLVVRPEGQTELKLDNNVSQGTQRAVPNAIGIKTNNPTGELDSISIEISGVSEDYIIGGVPYTFTLKGYDKYKNPVTLNQNTANYTFDTTEDITVNGNNFSINKEGSYTVTANYNGITTSKNIKVLSPVIAIKPRASKTSLSIGENTYIAASVVNKDGFQKDINPSNVSWSVDNTQIGYIQDNHFYAKSEGIAQVTANYNGFSASIAIAVGKSSISLEQFEQTRQLYMSYFPDNIGISGGAGINTTSYVQGKSSLVLNYKFLPNTSKNQATYVIFNKQPISININASEVAMWVRGDSSGNILKAVFKGSDGTLKNVSITENIDFNDWKYFRIEIPSELKTPVTLDKIYVGTLATTAAESGSIYIDDITQLIPRSDGGKLTNSYSDYLQTDIESKAPASNEEDITIFGQTLNRVGENSSLVLQNAINKMKANARAMIFVGDTNIENINTGVSTVQWNNKYYTTNTSYASIINLATKSGNMLTESENQWRWLQSYLRDFSKNNIIINMDKDIWSSSNSLTGSRENELFHKILKNFVVETNKNVIVVSATGDSTYSKVVDGIRYINLNGLTAQDSNNLNSYKYLRIRVNQNSLNYQICNVYN